MDTTNPDCTVLVTSCDKYADLLAPFEALFKKFWPDCPSERVLVTETEPRDPSPSPEQSAHIFTRTVACGVGGTWPDMLVAALETIETPYVLMLCADYFLDAPVPTRRLVARLEQMKRLKAANLRLIPNPKTFTPFACPGEDPDLPLGEYRKDTAYCVATQTGFWARDFLLRLARSVANIWDFERLGSFMVADEPRPLLVTPTREFPFSDVVHKGYWEKFGVALCEANGIAPDLAARGLPPLKVRLVEGIKKFVFFVFPTNWIVRVQNAFGLGAKETPCLCKARGARP